MRSLSCPVACTGDENCGVSLFTDTNGGALLLVVDYSVHDQAKLQSVTEKTVTLPGSEWHGAEAVDGRALRRLIGKDGVLEGIAVALHPHESALIRLF